MAGSGCRLETVQSVGSEAEGFLWKESSECLFISPRHFFPRTHLEEVSTERQGW